MGGPNLDPVKVAQFEKGWQQMQKDNVHDSQEIAKDAAIGTGIGAVAGIVIPVLTPAAGAGIGFLAGTAYGFIKVGYEKITHQGYYSGR